MDDTISRQAAIDAFRKELCRERVYATPFISFKGCERILNELPSAERRGRWVKVAEGWGSLWKCDQCGEMTVETVMGKPRANYCPNCGARMSGEQEKRQ